MGIVIFDIAKTEYQNSRNMTESLRKLHLEQTTEYNINRDELAKLKYNIKKEKLQLNTKRFHLCEKGASMWLSTLPLKEEGHCLLKQEFWDLVKIRYGWSLSRLPNMCSCRAKYDLQYSLSCKKCGFVTLRHNHLRNSKSN